MKISIYIIFLLVTNFTFASIPLNNLIKEGTIIIPNKRIEFVAPYVYQLKESSLSILDTDTSQFSLQSKYLYVNSEYCPQPNIEFDVGKSTIRPNSYPLLDSIVTFLKIHDNVFVEVQGHTDSDVCNHCSSKISQRRAQSVVDYLVQHGISRTRFKAKGYGEEMPLLPNITEENKAINRRIVFKILEIGR